MKSITINNSTKEKYNKIVHKLQPHLKKPQVRIALFALIAVIFMVVIRASNILISVQADSAIGTNVAVINDSTASNGRALLFGKCDGQEMQTEAVACPGQNSNGVLFREVFNGDPAGPEYVMNNLNRWFAQPTVQGPNGWTLNPRPMQAQHTHHCGPPPGTHEITTFEQSVYICRNHLMTAVNPPSDGTSSGIVGLKPNHMVDLSKGEASVKIDVSTKSPSKGDWWEIWITPYEDHLVSPADHWFHFAGPPKNALFFMVADIGNTKHWAPKYFENYRAVTGVLSNRDDRTKPGEFWHAPNIRQIVTESDTRRDTYEVKIKNKRQVEMWLQESATGEMKKVYEFTLPRDFPSDHAVVQFLQSNYEPELDGKFGCGDAANPCRRTKSAATWHWDNAEIYPAVPYSIIGVEEYLVWAGSDSKKINFKAPAPRNSDLMFNAMSWGNQPEVSFDNGNTWVKATAVRPPNDPPVAGFGGDPDLLSYRVPVPQGAISATIKGRGGNPPYDPNWSWGAMNFHLISLER